MESQDDGEDTDLRYRLWLVPLDEDESEGVSPISFTTIDELFQALFRRWDTHFHLTGSKKLTFPPNAEEV